VGDAVEFTGESAERASSGRACSRSIYDGLQNPLPELAEQSGFFLQRGHVFASAWIRTRTWAFDAGGESRATG
jgi:V/A-type H+-transporting ATPase subunit A